MKIITVTDHRAFIIISAGFRKYDRIMGTRTIVKHVGSHTCPECAEMRAALHGSYTPERVFQLRIREASILMEEQRK